MPLTLRQMLNKEKREHEETKYRLKATKEELRKCSAANAELVLENAELKAVRSELREQADVSRKDFRDVISALHRALRPDDVYRKMSGDILTRLEKIERRRDLKK